MTDTIIVTPVAGESSETAIEQLEQKVEDLITAEDKEPAVTKEVVKEALEELEVEKEQKRLDEYDRERIGWLVSDIGSLLSENWSQNSRLDTIEAKLQIIDEKIDALLAAVAKPESKPEDVIMIEPTSTPTEAEAPRKKKFAWI